MTLSGWHNENSTILYKTCDCFLRATKYVMINTSFRDKGVIYSLSNRKLKWVILF